MSTKRKLRKWTAAQIKNHIQRIQDGIEEQKRKNTYEHFVAITPDEIKKRLISVRSIDDEMSVLIVGQGWNSTIPGGTVDYHIRVHNISPWRVHSIYAHVWVGPAYIDSTISSYLMDVDNRFPRLTEPPSQGLVLTAGAYAELNFVLKVPSSIEKTNFIGNCCLMYLCGFGDNGKYLDRCCFVFAVK